MCQDKNYVCVYAQLSSTLCDPMDYNPSCSTAHEIFQARVLEWVAMPSSRISFLIRDRTWVSDIYCRAGRNFTAEPLGKPYILCTSKLL